ncbi:MAG: cupin domain-containing protein [Bacteroidales bacterium]|nr:cupin domain-containing protein [Bacteroidales bacterium]
MDATQIIEKLGLIPLSDEGGYYRETFKSADSLNGLCLPKGFSGKHSISTCIYYLITPESFSEIHKLPTEEIWHFYLGDTAEQIQISPEGEIKKIRFGDDLFSGEIPQVIVPGNTWQGTKLVDGGKFALFGTTMSPGFEFSDYVPGNQKKLEEAYPAVEHDIASYFHHHK